MLQQIEQDKHCNKLSQMKQTHLARDFSRQCETGWELQDQDVE